MLFAYLCCSLLDGALLAPSWRSPDTKEPVDVGGTGQGDGLALLNDLAVGRVGRDHLKIGNGLKMHK